MQVETVTMEEIHLDSANARKGSVPGIVESLREFGQHRPLVVQASTGRIIAGNHTYKAAQALGWKEIAVYRVDDDDVKAVRRGIADNATGDEAEWDEAALKNLLNQVGSDVPGITEGLLKQLAEIDLGAEAPSDPVYPLVPRAGEHYSYVLIIAPNVIDQNWLTTTFKLEKGRSYKNSAIGLSRILTVGRFQELLPEIHSQSLAGVEPPEEAEEFIDA